MSGQLKALVLAYDFPPRHAVSGLRPFSWYRYWPEFDVAPVVVTRQWGNRLGHELDYVAASDSPSVLVEENEHGTIIRTPYHPNLSNRLLLRYGPKRFRLLRRALTAWFEIAQYYVAAGPRRNFHTAAQRYLRERGADVIVATGEPFVLFRYAQELAREFGIPWVADYRDPWSDDPFRSKLQRRWEAPIERRLISSASAITTASGFWAEVGGAQLRGRPVRVIPNGYDPAAVATAAAEPQARDRLTLGYVGSVMPFYPFESFFRICDAFVQERKEPRLELVFVGVQNQATLEDLLARRFPVLAGVVTFHNRMPNADMARVLARSNALVAFNNYGFPGTKIYDYLGLRRHVLLCYSADPEALELKRRHYGYDDAGATDEGIMERLLDETGGGTVVRDADHLRVVLADLHAELMKTGEVACHSHGIERFSRRTQAGLMAEVLKEAVGQ